MRAVSLCCSLLVLVAGCFFGDPAAHRTVLLQLPVTVQTTANFSASDPGVQEALRIVDTVMASHGVSRDTNAPAQNERNMIAIYDIWIATGQKVVSAGPTVRLERDNLDIDFFEFPARRSSPHVRKVCSEIADALRSRYGHQSVRIVR